MNAKKILLCTVLLISATVASFAQNMQWKIFNAENSPLANNSVLTVNCGNYNGWMGTTSGLNYFNGTNWSSLNTQNSGLSGNHVNAIAREDNGALWIATNTGLSKLYDHEWTVYNMTNSPLPVDIIKCISIDAHGNKWIGTWGAGLVKFDGTDWTIYNTSNSELPGNGINCITIDSDDNIWVGTFNGGIGVFDQANWTTYNMSNSTLQSNDVRAINFDKDNFTWIGTSNGIMMINGGTWTPINSSVTGFPFSAVNSIVSGDFVWFASDHGIIKYNCISWLNYNVENSSIPANDVRAIDMDNNMNIWIATAGEGLAIYNPNGVVLSIENQSTIKTSINAFPNPVNGEVTLSFNTNETGNAELAIFDMQGRKVTTILNEEVGKGQHNIKFDTGTLPAGVYIWWVKFKDRVDIMQLAVI